MIRLWVTTGACEKTAAAVLAVGRLATSPRAKTFAYLLCRKEA